MPNFLVLVYREDSLIPDRVKVKTLTCLQRRYKNASFVSVFEWKTNSYKWCFDLNLKDVYHLTELAGV